MTFPSYKILLFFIGYFLLEFSFVQGQPINKVKEIRDSVRTDGRLVSFKDTIVVNNDTLIVRKEVWVKEKDSLILHINDVHLNNHSILFVKDTLIVVRDTIIVIQDTAISANARVLQHVKDYSERNTLLGKLLKGILVFNDPKPVKESLSTQTKEETERRYNPYEGKIIRNVNIKVLDVFGPTLDDPEKKPRSLLEKSGDFLHIKTQRWIVRNRLLFRTGDSINSLKISESERLLRASGNIYDARIYVNDTLQSDSVDVDVYVQDLWSISGSAGGDPTKYKFSGSLNDVNFLGLGHQIYNNLQLNPTLPKGYNYNGNYIINNIYKTFLTGQFYYRYYLGQTYYGGGVNRDFISPAIKWAGGINMDWNSFQYGLYNNKDSLISSQSVKYTQEDVWLGYGWNVFPGSYFKGTRLILSGRIVQRKFYASPILPDSIPNIYYNNSVYLGSIGLVARRFYREKYIFRLGRTEDIPEGYLLSLTGGYEQRAMGNRPYFAISSDFARFHKWGYLYTGINVGAFYNQNKWEQGVFNAQMLYFTPLAKLRNWYFRQYFGSRYTAGIAPLKGTYININQELGVRGFSSSLNGTNKLVVNYEIDFFPPLNLLGFRVANILFTDMAWISKGDKLVDKKNFFPGFGMGLRFRNDHLVFSTIQINLAYYPNNNYVNKNDWRLFERSRFYYTYYNFQFTKPSYLPYY